MSHPATVRVVAEKTADNPHGFIIINETDLTDTHELFVEGVGGRVRTRADRNERSDAPEEPKPAARKTATAKG